MEMEWTDAKYELPSKDCIVLTWGIPVCGGACEEVWAVRESRWVTHRGPRFEFGEYDCPLEVTHWMEFPDPPRITVPSGEPPVELPDSIREPLQRKILRGVENLDIPWPN